MVKNNNELIMIPKIEKYIEYMLTVLLKLPRTEKFSIGTDMASEYRDRVVHQWYVENFIEPYFVPQFINTTYACIEGRGMHKASRDVQIAMRRAKDKWKCYYILKMDVTKYFKNIDKRILWNILKRKIKEVV